LTIFLEASPRHAISTALTLLKRWLNWTHASHSGRACFAIATSKQATMNRAFITPTNGVKLDGPTTAHLIAAIERRIPGMKAKGITSTDLVEEHDGKRYSGAATMSGMGDVQWNIDHVEAVKEPAPAKTAAKKSAPKKAAAKKGAKRK
jgi:hypothetical protein